MKIHTEGKVKQVGHVPSTLGTGPRCVICGEKASYLYADNAGRFGLCAFHVASRLECLFGNIAKIEDDSPPPSAGA